MVTKKKLGGLREKNGARYQSSSIPSPQTSCSCCYWTEFTVCIAYFYQRQAWLIELASLPTSHITPEMMCLYHARSKLVAPPTNGHEVAHLAPCPVAPPTLHEMTLKNFLSHYFLLYHRIRLKAGGPGNPAGPRPQGRR
jgi:hypothetical protein